MIIVAIHSSNVVMVVAVVNSSESSTCDDHVVPKELRKIPCSV